MRNNRLVTIVGPGGVGKTQAALEAARSISGDFADGVWWFDCTTQTNGEALARWLAGMFDIRMAAEPDELIASIGDLLQTRRVLLVFDNCERIAEVLGKVSASLLSACAELHVLVTSQQRLNCAGESLLGLPPLQVPPPGEWTTDEQVSCLSSIPAVRLLLLRSRSLASGFALTPANAAAVAELCRRLDGLPLALELAAARLRILSPEQLLLRMHDRFRWHTDASGSRPMRHQTLGALIEWSFALLAEQERVLLRALGVFSGGWTLDGAMAIGDVFGFDGEHTFELLSGLIDKSLMAVDAAANPPRYRLLDSVRLFALGLLEKSDDEVRVRRAHLAHFVEFTARVNAEFQRGQELIWTERVRREWVNLHAAFDYAMRHEDLTDSALALVGNLCWYFRAGTDYLEAAHWLERALQTRRAPTHNCASALIADGVVSHFCRSRERAESRLREGIALARSLGDVRLAAAAEATLAFELATRGDFDNAEANVESALAVAVAHHDAWLHSLALQSRGIAHGMKNRHREAEHWLNLAAEQAALLGTDYFQLAYTVINRALQRFHLGDGRGAAQDWLFVLDFFARLQIWRGAAGCVEGSAYLVLDKGQPALAARFLGAAERVRRLTVPLFPQWREAHEATERAAFAALGEGFQSARREGADARFEDIVDEARALLMEIAAS